MRVPAAESGEMQTHTHAIPLALARSSAAATTGAAKEATTASEAARGGWPAAIPTSPRRDKTKTKMSGYLVTPPPLWATAKLPISYQDMCVFTVPPDALARAQSRADTQGPNNTRPQPGAWMVWLPPPALTRQQIANTTPAQFKQHKHCNSV